MSVTDGSFLKQEFIYVLVYRLIYQHLFFLYILV